MYLIIVTVEDEISASHTKVECCLLKWSPELLLRNESCFFISQQCDELLKEGLQMGMLTLVAVDILTSSPLSEYQGAC